MAGMTSLAKAACALAIASTASWANASADAPAVTPQKASTGDALIVSLEHGDLGRFAQGLVEGPLKAPMTGRYEERISQEYWFATVGVQGIAYSFRIADLRLVPRDGHLHADVQISDLNVNVEWLTFNESGSRFCQNVPIWSGQSHIPAWGDVHVGASGRRVAVETSGVGIGLGGDNFVFGEPAYCDTIWGFNWLVRYLVPWIGGLARDRIAEGVAEAAAKAAREVGQDLDQMLSINITWPFDIEPAPAFYATVGIWPHKIETTPDRFKVVMGADLDLDPDTAERPALPQAKPRRFASLFDTSFLGLGRPLLAMVLQEANEKGLFNLTLSQTSAPKAQDLLKAHTLAPILPDAATRFAPDTPISLELANAARTAVSLEPMGPGGFPIIDMLIEGLPLRIDAAGAPYYHATLDLNLRFAFGYDAPNRRLVLSFQSFDARYAGGRFADGLSPAPTDTRTDLTAFTALVRQIEGRLVGGAGSMFSLEVPDLALGERTLRLWGSSVREDYVTLDAIIQ